MNILNQVRNEVYTLAYECIRDFEDIRKEEHKVSLYKED